MKSNKNLEINYPTRRPRIDANPMAMICERLSP